MKTAKTTFLLILACASLSLDGGEAQERFLRATENCVELIIKKIDPGNSPRVLLDTKKSEKIEEVISSIDFEDPKKEYSKDGDLIIQLPPFCVYDYTLSFFTRENKIVEYGIYGCADLALPPKELWLEHSAAIGFTDISEKRLGSILKFYSKNIEPVAGGDATRWRS